MNILLVAINSDMFPVGIALISASLKQAGHYVDCFVYENSADLINQLESKYDIVATGGLSSQYLKLKEISDIVSERNIKLIVGGGIITSEPELMSRALKADYAVIGEGEETIVDLLDCVTNESDISKVDGIGYFAGNTYVLNNERKPNYQLDLLPYPDYESFGYDKIINTAKPSDQYYYDLFDNPREYPIITSRSCPFKCTFCYHPLGDKYRQRSIASIMDELKTVIPKYRINIVSIYDELFAYNEERVYEFCRQFKNFITTIPWEVKWNCQMKVSGLKNDMLDMMQESGCYMVSYGFESYSPIVLKSMKKGITPEQIDNAIKATLDRRISIQANFIFGDRAETINTALETLSYWKSHPEAGILLGFIIACPNSEMYQHCIEKGIIEDRLDFITNHMFDIMNMTSMSDSDFITLRALVAKYSYQHIVTATPLKRLPDSVSVRCPHCHEIITYQNFVMHGTRMNKMVYCRNCRKRFFIVSRLSKITKYIESMTNSPLIYKYRLMMKSKRKRLKNIIKSYFVN